MSQLHAQVAAARAARKAPKRSRYIEAVRAGDAVQIAETHEEAGVPPAQLKIDLDDFARMGEYSAVVAKMPAIQNEYATTKAEIERLEQELQEEQERIHAKLKPLRSQFEQLGIDAENARKRLGQLHGLFEGLYRRGLAKPEDLPAEFRGELTAHLPQINETVPSGNQPIEEAAEA